GRVAARQRVDLFVALRQLDVDGPFVVAAFVLVDPFRLRQKFPEGLLGAAEQTALPVKIPRFRRQAVMPAFGKDGTRIVVGQMADEREGSAGLDKILGQQTAEEFTVGVDPENIFAVNGGKEATQDL